MVDIVTEWNLKDMLGRLFMPVDRVDIVTEWNLKNY